MKRSLAIALCLIVCFWTVACGIRSPFGGGSTYLSQQERVDFERELLNNLTVVSAGEGSEVYIVSFVNPSRYNVMDLCLYTENPRTRLLYCPLLANETSARLEVYVDDTVDIENQSFLLEYVIGDFAYSTTGINLKVGDNPKAYGEDKLRVTVETSGGTVELDCAGTVDFSEMKIKGLDAIQVTSITGSFNYDKTFDVFSSLTFQFHTEKPTGNIDDVYYRLVDENGVILAIDDIFLLDGNEFTLYYFNGLRPGEYTIKFDERKLGG